jgi:hypothetical protein
MMAVVNSLEGFRDCWRETSRCGPCGGELYPPFVMYCCGGDGLFICGSCARHIAKGLSADLLHCVAAVELQQLFPEMTLVRHSVAKLEAEERKRWGRCSVLFSTDPPSGGDAA